MARVSLFLAALALLAGPLFLSCGDPSRTAGFAGERLDRSAHGRPAVEAEFDADPASDDKPASDVEPASDAEPASGGDAGKRPGLNGWSVPERVGALPADGRLPEISGLVASRRHAGILWAHNDSGDAPRIFALREDGSCAATIRVLGARAVDWEDIAIAASPESMRAASEASVEASASEASASEASASEASAEAEPDPIWPFRVEDARIYIADTGNNDRSRDVLQVYRIPEPELAAGVGRLDGRGGARRADARRELEIGPAEVFPFRYPDGPFDCESLVAHPTRPEVWLFTKEAGGVGVYSIEVGAVTGRVVTARAHGKLDLGALATAAALSPKGDQLALRFYWGVCELRAGSGECAVDAIFSGDGPRPGWRESVHWLVPPPEIKGEALAYSADANCLYATSEGDGATFFRLRRRSEAR